MSNDLRPDLLAVRALNACHRTHKPTYVGLRSLLDSEADQERVRWSAAIATHKAVTRSDWRYFAYPTLKDIERDGSLNYRDCLVGSPTTLLSEAYVLFLLAGEPSFAVPKNVYSYLWPTTHKSGRNFQYYQRGYGRRNARITGLLKKHPNHVAVVSDIRRFYPSVEWSYLMPKVLRRISEVQSAHARRAIRGFIDGVRPKTSKGIPIGPDVGHVLGNIALEDVDAHLSEAFGESYFRYVDDIIVVCAAEDRHRAFERVQSHLASIGLALHEGKTDVVEAATWVDKCPQMLRTREPGSFEALMHDLCIYLALWPRRMESLQRAFVGEGFPLPFGRLVAQSRYGPFLRFAWHFLRRRGVVTSFRYSLFNEKRFLAMAEAVRARMRETLEQLVSRRVPPEGMTRRWFVQKCRYCISRLLYLTAKEEYGELRAMIPAGHEFAEYRALLEGLIANDPTGLLKMPGRVLGTFCELTPAEQPPPVIRVSGSASNARAVAESFATLAVYLGCSVPAAALEELYPGSRILVEICSGGKAAEEKVEWMSYLDEIELLLRGVPQTKLAALARTRLSEREAIGLEGLLLGGDYGVS